MMAAWGPKVFDNDLARMFVRQIVERDVLPLLVEARPRNYMTSGAASNSQWHTKAFLAWYYDRVRAAVELLLLLDERGAYEVVLDYWLLCDRVLAQCTEDGEWLWSWGGQPDPHPSRGELTVIGKNYLADVRAQRARVRAKIDATLLQEKKTP
jgi:hypothetical protein